MMKLSCKKFLVLALALVTLDLCAAAQEQDPPADEGSTPARSGKVAPRTKVPVSVPVHGITPERLGEIVEAVLALQHDTWACPTCKQKSRRAGKCGRCEVERTKVDPSKVMQRVELQVDRRFLSVTLEPHHFGSLAELGELLGKFDASVKPAEFRLPTFSRIRVTGVVDEKAATRLRNGLVDLKVVPACSVELDAEAQAAWVMPRVGDEPVTVGDVEAALAKMRGELAVADVQWADYCPLCGTRSVTEMGGPNCKTR